MSPDGQKALIAGGITAFGSEHLCKPTSLSGCTELLPDLFELDLNSTCWVQARSHHDILACKATPALSACTYYLSNAIMTMQIVPRGRMWTSAFSACGGGYLQSNHVALIGLTRYGKLHLDLPAMPIKDWANAVNIRFQRNTDIVKNILAADRHGIFQQPCPSNVHQGMPGWSQESRTSMLTGPLHPQRKACPKTVTRHEALALKQLKRNISGVSRWLQQFFWLPNALSTDSSIIHGRAMMTCVRRLQPG